MRNLDIKLCLKRLRLIFLLGISLTCLSVYSAEAQEIWEIGSYVKSNGFQSSDPFMDLRYGSGGIIEVADGRLIVPGTPSPTNLMVASTGLGNLPTEPGLYGSVQFMQVNAVEGAAFSLRPEQLASFPGLRYILVVSPAALTESQVSGMFPGFAGTGIVILYQISRPG